MPHTLETAPLLDEPRDIPLTLVDEWGSAPDDHFRIEPGLVTDYDIDLAPAQGNVLETMSLALRKLPDLAQLSRYNALISDQRVPVSGLIRQRQMIFFSPAVRRNAAAGYDEALFLCVQWLETRAEDVVPESIGCLIQLVAGPQGAFETSGYVNFKGVRAAIDQLAIPLSQFYTNMNTTQVPGKWQLSGHTPPTYFDLIFISLLDTIRPTVDGAVKSRPATGPKDADTTRFIQALERLDSSEREALEAAMEDIVASRHSAVHNEDDAEHELHEEIAGVCPACVYEALATLIDADPEAALSAAEVILGPQRLQLLSQACVPQPVSNRSGPLH